MKISEIYENPDNPRTISDKNLEKLCKSVKSFEKMMTLRPIIVDTNGMILGGNMRYKAFLESETDICEGDIIEIGKHILLCGDSTNEKIVS
jgi:hypothetical protein